MPQPLTPSYPNNITVGHGSAFRLGQQSAKMHSLSNWTTREPHIGGSRRSWGLSELASGRSTGKRHVLALAPSPLASMQLTHMHLAAHSVSNSCMPSASTRDLLLLGCCDILPLWHSSFPPHSPISLCQQNTMNFSHRGHVTINN